MRNAAKEKKVPQIKKLLLDVTADFETTNRDFDEAVVFYLTRDMCSSILRMSISLTHSFM